MEIKMKSGQISGSRVVIDGREFKGSRISILNGKVTVDGELQSGEGDLEMEKSIILEALTQIYGK